MILLDNLHKSFGTQKVLDGLQLEIPKGKLTVIIGKSGEGKSVLIKHIMGLLQPDSGRVLIDGKCLAKLTTSQVIELRKKMGMVFQHAALFDSLTVAQNIAFPLVEHTNLTKTQMNERIDKVLELVGLDAVHKKLPHELSGGMQKRVGLARAIIHEPEILLYDEPTTGLDPIMTKVIDELILKTQKTLGITSVVISHDIEAALDIADCIAMLKEGKILLRGTKKDFLESNDPFIQHFLRRWPTSLD